MGEENGLVNDSRVLGGRIRFEYGETVVHARIKAAKKAVEGEEG